MAIAPPNSTGQVSQEEIKKRIQALLTSQRAFFADGHTLPVAFRKEQLRKLQRVLKQHEQELFDALYADFRKPALEAFGTEIGFIELELKLALKSIEDWACPRRVPETLINFPARSYVYPQPYGVTLIISPWNYPLNLLFTPLIGAMAAGNCAILKPSEIAPNTAAVVNRLITQNFDERYLAVVEGGVETSQELLAQRFDYIFFTGSTQVGRIVMKAAAEYLTPVTLELGGKSPAIVVSDTDLELAARRICWGKFLNAGQTCVAPDYVLVQEDVKEEFIQQMAQCIKEFYGEQPLNSPDFARIINDNHFQRLSAMLTPEHVRIGGETDAADRYIAPTVLDNIAWDHPSMQEEIFGPVLPILTFETIDEAIKIVNRHEKPLALYFFSANKLYQQRILHEVTFGGGCINDTISHLANPNLPFGGVGSSGLGSYHGIASFDVFSHQKSVLHRGTWLDLPFRYPPYGNKLNLLRRFFKWL
ncbi:aldehyde dehydrogenase [Pontibacter sp. KCTC 32443]|uniref:aldehyde dehydrogenase n=1 Tax=Pontibacter TaxID=323449 RepID=UPI00164DAE74|nr:MULTISPECIES: aldehyde dehydrogenase [Pontibacter]MBC5772664.1 aldehyde dehydrogenase [Pontibacter sp. KCTC 32443]